MLVSLGFPWNELPVPSRQRTKRRLVSEATSVSIIDGELFEKVLIGIFFPPQTIAAVRIKRYFCVLSVMPQSENKTSLEMA